MIGIKLVVAMQLLESKVFYSWFLHERIFNNIFLVDVSLSDLKITKIDRINTWLTCVRHGCPAANGSNNVIRDPDEDLKFWIYLRRDGTLKPPFTAQRVKEDDGIEIHYEVEGPCA